MKRKQSGKSNKKTQRTSEVPDGLMPDPDRTSSYEGYGPKKPNKTKFPPNNLYRFNDRYFHKIKPDPPLF